MTQTIELGLCSSVLRLIMCSMGRRQNVFNYLPEVCKQ